MFFNYVKISLRNIRRRKAYAVINILGLAIGLSSCIFIMLYVQDELNRDRFHTRADRLYRVTNDYSSDTGVSSAARTAPLLGPELEAEFPEVEQSVRFKTFGGIAAHGDKRFYEQDGFYAVDSEIFQVFTFPLIKGDPSTALQDPFSLVLSLETARKYFGDEDPMGKTITIREDYEFTVTGVLAPIPFNSHIQVQLLMSFGALETFYGSDALNTWQNNIYYTYLLLREGTDSSVLASKIPAFVERNISPGLSEGTSIALPLQLVTDIHLYSDRQHDLQTGGDITSVYLFSGIAIFILIVACINFMNLATARSAGRAREVGLRKAVGAVRGQLISQFLGESVVFAVLAALLALVIVQFALPAFNEIAGKQLAVGAIFSFEIAVIIGAMILLSGVLAGSYPALYLSAFEPARVLKGKVQASRSGRLLRQWLVVLQFAISIALIAGTDIAFKQLNFLRTTDMGFDKEQILVVPFFWEPIVQQRYGALKSELEGLPSVDRITASGDIPGRMFTSLSYNTERDDGPASGGITSLLVGSDFAKTYKATLVAGRDFDSGRQLDASGKGYILNEAAVSAIGWNSPDDAVGRKFSLGGREAGQVVGVVRDFNVTTLQESIKPLAMGVWPDWFGYLSIRVQSEDIPGTLAAIEGVWNTVIATLPFEPFFLDAALDRQYQSEQRLSQVFGTFSAMAIFIACLGLFGLISFTAEQRTREIGIRKVLGASVAGVVGMLSWDFVKLVLAANLVAIPVTYIVMNAWLSDFAYHDQIGMGTFVLSGILTLGIALSTVGYQAIRAALTNPVDALQFE
ncbi:MAG: FtsX-like permease family protein [Candidatus Latescibacteria bacterium]|nr:FtsX-like permease family protein [Candidatus Latescibacterota bacterium]